MHKRFGGSPDRSAAGFGRRRRSTPRRPSEAQARRAGYATCLSYDLDSLDYTDPTPAAVVHNVLSQVANGSIVSMHCGHATTIAAIGPILDGLRARGLQAVTMSELVAA